MRIPREGHRVRLLIAAIACDHHDNEITLPVGAEFFVARRRLLDGAQGFQFQLESDEHDIMIFVDETDLIDGAYPIEFA